MKQFTFILAMLLSIGAFSQNVSWGENYKTEDNSSVYNYIGTIGETDYYSFGYKTTGFTRRFNRVGLMAVNKNNVTNYTEEYIDIPLFSLFDIVATDENIAIIYKEETNDTYEIRCILVDKNTLKEKSDKILLSYKMAKKDSPSVSLFASKDKSKYVLTYFNSNKKEKENYLIINVFDKNLTKLYSTQYRTEADADVSILNIAVANNSDIYVLAKTVSKTEKERLLLSRITEDERTEKEVGEDFDISDIEMHIINKDKVFIAINNGKGFKGITYDMEQEEVTNTVNFEYVKEKEKLFWYVKDILELENGNLIVVIQDSYKVIADGTSFAFFNRNFYALCVDVNQSSLVYSQLVSKATGFYNHYDVGYGQFETPFFFTKGNDFYAIYNTDKDDNDLCGEAFIETNIILTRKSKAIVANILKLSPNSAPILKNLFFQSEAKQTFSANLSLEKANGEIIIGRRGDKNINFGTLNIK
jgi:hypothetical protein